MSLSKASLQVRASAPPSVVFDRCPVLCLHAPCKPNSLAATGSRDASAIPMASCLPAPLALRAGSAGHSHRPARRVRCTRTRTRAAMTTCLLVRSSCRTFSSSRRLMNTRRQESVRHDSGRIRQAFRRAERHEPRQAFVHAVPRRGVREAAERPHRAEVHFRRRAYSRTFRDAQGVHGVMSQTPQQLCACCT